MFDIASRVLGLGAMMMGASDLQTHLNDQTVEPLGVAGRPAVMLTQT